MEQFPTDYYLAWLCKNDKSYTEAFLIGQLTFGGPTITGRILPRSYCLYLVLTDDDGLDGLHDVDAACAPLGSDDPVGAGQVHVPVIKHKC